MRNEQKKRVKKGQETGAGACRRLAAIWLAIGLVAVTGCGQTEEETETIVTLKEDGAEENGENRAEPTGSAGQQSGTGSIPEQVQAPDVYQISFTDKGGALQILVDAQVLVPSAEGFRLKSVAGRTFTQEDYDRVMEGVLSVTDRELTGWVVNEEGKEEQRNFLPQIRYDAEAATSGKEGANFIAGDLTVGDEKYTVLLDNNLTPDFRIVSFTLERRSGTWLPSPEPESGEEGLKAMTEQIALQAQEAVKKAGFTDMVPFGNGYFCMSSFDESQDGELVEELYGYGIHFVRNVDGVPVTYTNETGSTEEGDIPAWPYESLQLVYDEKGLVNFQWMNPCTVTDMSTEYVFLLPFEEIQQVFRQMMPEKYGEYLGDGDRMTFQINEIRLGYMRIMNQGNPTEGTLVPVWDFMGDMERTVGGSGDGYEIVGPYESWLTINAMDGSVIDRGLGY